MSWRSWKFTTRPFPKMQTIPAIRNVIDFRRMKLHHAFVVLPKQFLNLVHFLPGRASVWKRNRDVLPFLIRWRDHHFKRRLVSFDRNKKETKVFAWFCFPWASFKAKWFKRFKTFHCPPTIEQFEKYLAFPQSKNRYTLHPSFSNKSKVP